MCNHCCCVKYKTSMNLTFEICGEEVDDHIEDMPGWIETLKRKHVFESEEQLLDENSRSIPDFPPRSRTMVSFKQDSATT